MDSIKLDIDTWDIALTAGGSIAVVSSTERVAQDVSTYVRTWQGECWYDTDAGIPYLNRELATLPPAELVRERARRRALEVPNVLTATVTLTDFAERVLTGNIHVTTDDGDSVDVGI